MGKGMDWLLRTIGISKVVRTEDKAGKIWNLITMYRLAHQRICTLKDQFPEIDEEGEKSIKDLEGTSSMISELLHCLALGAITKDGLVTVLKTLHETWEQAGNLAAAELSMIEREMKEKKANKKRGQEIEEDPIDAVHLNMVGARFGMRCFALDGALQLIDAALDFKDARYPPLGREIKAMLDRKKAWEAYMNLARMGDELFAQYHCGANGVVNDVPPGKLR